jgi:hypothetical protein
MQARHCVIYNDGYWCNPDNHGNGCNCCDNKDHEDKLERGSAAVEVAAEAWRRWWRRQEWQRGGQTTINKKQQRVWQKRQTWRQREQR